MGVTECDNMLMLLGVSNKMSEKVGDKSADTLIFKSSVWQISTKNQLCQW